MSYSSRYSPARFKKSRWGNVQNVFIIAFLVLAVVGVGFSIFAATSITSATSTGCVVTEKDRSTGYKGRSDMRVYAEGCNGSSETKVFSVSDNWFAGQFASADTYGKIEVGKTYDFETRGMRVPIISSFENIVGVTAK
jgi:hypothetical protein